MEALRVLIVGAGLAGLALARALGERGITVEVVERTTGWDERGTGLYLPGNAVRALRALGVGSAVAARAGQIERQRILDHRGRLLVDIDVAAFWDGVGPCMAIRHAALHEALRGAAGVPIRLATSVAALEDGDRPEVSFSDGSNGSYDLVVGADGVHSTVRRLAIGGRAANYVGQTCWRFVVDGFPAVRGWTALLGAGRTFLTVALGGAAVYCYADVNTNDPAGTAAADWRELFGGFAEPVPRLLEHGADAYPARVEEVVPPVWRARRVVFVGDAAHASSPNMAQGAAMAVEDALVLAEVLAERQPVEQALVAYEDRRSARVAWLQQQTHRRDRTRSLPAALRNLTLRLAGERIFRSNYGPLLDAM